MLEKVAFERTVRIRNVKCAKDRFFGIELGKQRVGDLAVQFQPVADDFTLPAVQANKQTEQSRIARQLLQLRTMEQWSKELLQCGIIPIIVHQKFFCLDGAHRRDFHFREARKLRAERVGPHTDEQVIGRIRRLHEFGYGVTKIRKKLLSSDLVETVQKDGDLASIE